METILVVEDDEVTRRELKELLQKNGYEVLLLENFKDAPTQIQNLSFDLLLLDINIPYLNGEVLLQQFRKTSNLPVIMVTSRNFETDEALSISYGADDYITKPYNPNILLLRIGAVLKRSNTSLPLLTYKDLNINTQKATIRRGEKEILLTKNEMLIFSYLLSHQNRIVTRDELMTILWDNAEYVNENALTVNISRLRNKLKEIGYPNAIATRKKVGYILS